MKIRGCPVNYAGRKNFGLDGFQIQRMEAAKYALPDVRQWRVWAFQKILFWCECFRSLAHRPETASIENSVPWLVSSRDTRSCLVKTREVSGL